MWSFACLCERMRISCDRVNGKGTGRKKEQTKESIVVAVVDVRKGEKTWKILRLRFVWQQIPTVCQSQVIYGLIVSFAYVILLQFIPSYMIYLACYVWLTADCRNCWLHHFMNYYCYYVSPMPDAAVVGIRLYRAFDTPTECTNERTNSVGQSVSSENKAKLWQIANVKHVLSWATSTVLCRFYDLLRAKWSLRMNRISHQHV